MNVVLGGFDASVLSALDAKGFSCLHYAYGIAVVLLMCNIKYEKPHRHTLS